jgi:ABC-type transport system involved in multi-copper enzyme maturation permease subunit
VIALVRVEVQRLLARRLARVLVLLAIAGILLAGVLVFFKSSAEGRASVPQGYFVDPRFHLASLHDIWIGVGGQLVVVGWLLGASFIGAEWHAGTMTTFLTWEPRRARVFFAKLIACAAVAFIATILLELLVGAALLPAAVWRGTTAGVDAADLAWLLLRAGVAAVFGTSLGYALGAIGRNTAASLGVGFVYIVVLENLVHGLRPQWQGWLLSDNLATFLTAAGDPVIPGRSPAAAAGVVTIYGAAALVVALTLFRRRDVT